MHNIIPAIVLYFYINDTDIEDSITKKLSTTKIDYLN